MPHPQLSVQAAGLLQPFPMQELDEIECAIKACDAWRESLLKRQHLLLAELERRTLPAGTKHEIELGAPGFLYRGTFTPAKSAVDLYRKVLRALWTEHPDMREEMAGAMAARGVFRSYVAREVQTLFPGRPSWFARRHSDTLPGGWVFDTNLSPQRIEILAREAARAAGVRWGDQLIVSWP